MIPIRHKLPVQTDETPDPPPVAYTIEITGGGVRALHGIYPRRNLALVIAARWSAELYDATDPDPFVLTIIPIETLEV